MAGLLLFEKDISTCKGT